MSLRRRVAKVRRRAVKDRRPNGAPRAPVPWETLAQLPRAVRCQTLEQLPFSPPYSRRDLTRVGVAGLQVGCLNRMHRGVLNLDLCEVSDERNRCAKPGRIYLLDGTYRFIRHDVTTGLPFRDRALDWIYAEHFIEHIAEEQAITWLVEVKRTLRPGGLVRLTTPDLELYVDGYLDPKGEFFAEHRARMEALGCPPMEKRRAWMVNQIFRFWGHRFIYDFDELCYVLRAAGFAKKSIKRYAVNAGSDPRVCSLDAPIRSDETLYVEARTD